MTVRFRVHFHPPAFSAMLGLLPCECVKLFCRIAAAHLKLNLLTNNSKDEHPEFLIPRRLEVKAASGKGFNFHNFSILNSSTPSGEVVRKLCVQKKKWGVWYIERFHKSLWLHCVLECLKQTKKVLFMVVANHQLAAAFQHRNTSALQGYLEPTEVVPYP